MTMTLKSSAAQRTLWWTIAAFNAFVALAA